MTLRHAMILAVGILPVACGYPVEEQDEWGTSRAELDSEEPMGPYGEWSAPVWMGIEINTTAQEARAAITPNGKTLYFDSDRPESMGGLDFFVVQREKKTDT